MPVGRQRQSRETLYASRRRKADVDGTPPHRWLAIALVLRINPLTRSPAENVTCSSTSPSFAKLDLLACRHMAIVRDDPVHGHMVCLEYVSKRGVWLIRNTYHALRLLSTALTLEDISILSSRLMPHFVENQNTPTARAKAMLNDRAMLLHIADEGCCWNLLMKTSKPARLRGRSRRQ